MRTNYITGARDDLEWEEYSLEGIAQKNRYAWHLVDADACGVEDISNLYRHMILSILMKISIGS